jgi:hypothetical protein
MEDKLFICVCQSPEHQIIIRKDPFDEKLVYVSIHLSEYPWYIRVLKGIKYIFGFKTKYGHFDEIILGQEHVNDLRKIINYLSDNNFQELLYAEMNKLPYEKHVDDGQYNDGVQSGFELGATWTFKLLNT